MNLFFTGKHMSEKQGFMIIITAEDHKIIDLTMGDLLKTIRSSGAVTKGPILGKNIKLENGVVVHTRKLKVLEPTAETTTALSDMTIPKDVRCKIIKA
jgi:ribosomal protein S10